MPKRIKNINGAIRAVTTYDGKTKFGYKVWTTSKKVIRGEGYANRGAARKAARRAVQDPTFAVPAESREEK